MKPRPRDPLEKVQRDSGRIIAFTALVTSCLVILVVAGGGWTFLRIYHELQVANRSTCDFYRLIGTAPIQISGPQKTSRLGVQIIGSAREAYTGRNCGVLPPNPGIDQLEEIYHLPRN